MLVLPIKKKWFNMIKSGEKKEEYREIKPCWTKRFENETDRQFDIGILKKVFLELYLVYEVMFKAGYNKNAPKMVCKCTIDKRTRQTRMGSREGKRILCA